MHFCNYRTQNYTNYNPPKVIMATNCVRQSEREGERKQLITQLRVYGNLVFFFLFSFFRFNLDEHRWLNLKLIKTHLLGWFYDATFYPCQGSVIGLNWFSFFSLNSIYKFHPFSHKIKIYLFFMTNWTHKQKGHPEKGEKNMENLCRRVVINFGCFFLIFSIRIVNSIKDPWNKDVNPF